MARITDMVTTLANHHTQANSHTVESHSSTERESRREKRSIATPTCRSAFPPCVCAAGQRPKCDLYYQRYLPLSTHTRRPRRAAYSRRHIQEPVTSQAPECAELPDRLELCNTPRLSEPESERERERERRICTAARFKRLTKATPGGSE